MDLKQKRTLKRLLILFSISDDLNFISSSHQYEHGAQFILMAIYQQQVMTIEKLVTLRVIYFDILFIIQL